VVSSFLAVASASEVCDNSNSSHLLDSQWIALGSLGGARLHVINCLTGSEHTYAFPDDENDVSAVAWAPDGNSLAIAREDVLLIWGWALYEETVFDVESVHSLAYTPSGDKLVVWHDGFDDLPRITVVDINSGTQRRSSALMSSGAFPFTCRQIACSQREDYIGIVGSDIAHPSVGMLFVYDIVHMRRRQRFKVGTWVADVAYDPSGATIAVGSLTGIALCDVNLGSRASLLCDVAVCSLAYSPSGAYLAVGIAQKDVLLVDASSGTVVYSSPLPFQEDFCIERLDFVRDIITFQGFSDEEERPESTDVFDDRVARAEDVHQDGTLSAS